MAGRHARRRRALAEGDAKSAVAVTHTKLPDRAAVENARKYWHDRLDALRAALLRGSAH